MPRKKSNFPTPSLRFKCGSWCIRWSWERKPFEFSTGYEEHQKEEAETALSSLSLAMRTGDWPEWTENILVIQRWRQKQQPPKSSTKLSSEQALNAWKDNYLASARPEQVSIRLDHLNKLTDVYDLLS